VANMSYATSCLIFFTLACICVITIEQYPFECSSGTLDDICHVSDLYLTHLDFLEIRGNGSLIIDKPGAGITCDVIYCKIKIFMVGGIELYPYTSIKGSKIEIETIQGNITIHYGAQITTKSLGYPSQFGPGKGTAGTGPNQNTVGNGASYGGRGGSACCLTGCHTSETYGENKLRTLQLGSGGGPGKLGLGSGGPGGGSIWIRLVEGYLVLYNNFVDEGVACLDASGDGSQVEYGGGGSGGSILIEMLTPGRHLQWSMKDEYQRLNLIVAKGGDSNWGLGGGGGGGRVAIFYNASSTVTDLYWPYRDQLHLIVNVYGGISNGQCGSNGEIGTLYINWCHAGSYVNVTDGKCIHCRNGTYSPDHGADICIHCAKGSYQDKEGQTNCNDCPEGKYNDDIGQSQCKLCPFGHYQNKTGQSSCEPCPADTYQPVEGQSKCEPCSAGRYSQPGATTCIACVPGTYRDNTTKSIIGCALCPAGTYNTNYESASLKDCQPCPVNTYSGEGSRRCAPCLLFEYSDNGASRCNISPYVWIVLVLIFILLIGFLLCMIACVLSRKGYLHHNTIGRLVPNESGAGVLTRREYNVSSSYGSLNSDPTMVEYDPVMEERPETSLLNDRSSNTFRNTMITSNSYEKLDASPLKYIKSSTSEDQLATFCEICYENEKNTAFDCGHIVCRACSATLTHCPYCNEVIQSRIEVYNV
jgi:hypothetical protein